MSARPDGFEAVWVHESLRAAAQSKRRRDALQSGWMDAAFHYLSVRQAELWLNVHRSHAPVFADASFGEVFERAAASTAAVCAGKAVHVIGLGSGGGQKEASVLRVLGAAGCRLRYTPVDVGVELALESARMARPWVMGEVRPLAADLRSVVGVENFCGSKSSDEIRVVTAFGLLPNFFPSEIFGLLGQWVGPGDLLLLSANLAPISGAASGGGELAEYQRACRTILPQYDNAETRRWLRQVLVEWGVDTRLSAMQFGIEPIEEVLAVCARCAWTADEPFSWEGSPLEILPGSDLRLFFSLRYTPEILSGKLPAFGLKVLREEVTPCGEEGVWLVARSEAELVLG